MTKTTNRALLIIIIVFLSLIFVIIRVRTEEFNRFLTLPFTDVHVRVQQGWLYANDGLHKPKGAIDYARDDFGTFTVVAAADGIAIQDQEIVDGKNAGYGNLILIRHDETNSQGLHYYTLYAHLDPVTIDSRIPEASRFKKIVEEIENPGTEVKGFRVSRGDPIAVTDTTGDVSCNDCSILHFEVFIGGYFQNMIDPYNISTSLLSKDRNYYPGGSFFADCGPNYLWIECPPSFPVSETVWPMFQYDPQHTGHTLDDTSITLSNVPTWTYQVGGMITSSPSIVGDVAYFGSSDGKVHKFDATTGIGEVIYSTGPSLWSAVAISGPKIYIVGASTLGEQPAYLYSLNASDGTEVWPPVLLGSGGRGVSYPVVFDDVIYVGSGSGLGPYDCPAEGHWVNAISAETGDVLWQAPIIDPNECRKDVLSSPAVTQNSVVVGTWGSCNVCPTVFAFDRLTGAFKWSAIVDVPYVHPNPSIANGLVYVISGGAGYSRRLIAFNEQTGEKLWETEDIGSATGPGCPSIADGVVYTSSNHSIHAFNAITGAPIWVPPIPAPSVGNCASGIAYSFHAVANGMVFIKSNNSCNFAKVYAISTTDGQLVWDTGDLGDNIAAGGSDTSTPAVSNGRVYFGIGNTFYVYGE